VVWHEGQGYGMRFPVTLVALFLAAAVPSAAAQPAHWTVDSAKSRLSFSVQWSGEAFTATFKRWKADILFDPSDLAHSRASVSIDMASEGSDFPDNDEGLKGTQGFETSKFPVAKFDATHFVHGSGNSYTADATLSLHGLTKHVTLPFTLVITGKTAHMTGRTSLMRADFGLAGGEFSGDTPIAHAVTVNVDLTATRS
jgi:polyisoprenoid-binding protein YceI